MLTKTSEIDIKLIKERFEFNKIIIDVTNRCNLNCPVCYLGTHRSKEDLPVEEIRTLSREYRNKVILICGGEPTIRDDLPEIIKLFNKYNSVFLITNGLRLTDYDYLKELKQSGLRYISFSFNGFSDEVYQKINGAPLRDKKLKALDNIRKSKIKVILSVLIVKDINENQIASILDYCLKNRDFIEELRIRSMVPFGSHLHHEKYSVSDLLQLICKSKDFSREEILREVQLQQQINAVFRGKFFPPRDCSLNFHLMINGQEVTPVGRRIKNNRLNQVASYSLLPISFKLLRTYGMKMVTKGLLKILFKYEKLPWIHYNNTFKIGLRSWPEAQEFGLKELENCQTAYYHKGNLIPFCYANIQRTAGNI